MLPPTTSVLNRSSTIESGSPRPRVWERLSAPASLNGVRGSFRLSTERLLLPLTNDLEAVKVWLESSTSQPTSGRIYRCAMEKFLNWTWLVRKKAVSSLDESDFEAYARFLEDPQPAAVWQSGTKVLRDTAAWAPFISGLKRDAVAFNLIVISSLVTWMAEVGYARLPFVVGTRSARETIVRMGHVPSLRARQGVRVVLDPCDVHLVWSALSFAKETVFTRTKLQFLLQYHGGLKAAEVARIAVRDLRMPATGPWALIVPDRPPELSVVALLPTVRATLVDYLHDHLPRTSDSLLGVTDSDVVKANRRFLDLAAELCEESDQGAFAGRRLRDLKAGSLHHAFAAHAAMHGVAAEAWQLIAARRQSLPGGLREQGTVARTEVTARSYETQARALQPVVSLLGGQPA